MKKLTLTAILLLLLSTTAFADEISDILPYLIQVESGGNPIAVSKAGAIGLSQVTPIVLEEWKNEAHKMRSSGTWIFTDLYNPEYNVRIASWYLRRLRDHYGCKTIEQCLAGYNGGITRLRNNNYDINKMPSETKAYVKKIMRLKKEADEKNEKAN